MAAQKTMPLVSNSTHLFRRHSAGAAVTILSLWAAMDKLSQHVFLTCVTMLLVVCFALPCFLAHVPSVCVVSGMHISNPPCLTAIIPCTDVGCWKHPSMLCWLPVCAEAIESWCHPLMLKGLPSSNKQQVVPFSFMVGFALVLHALWLITVAALFNEDCLLTIFDHVDF